MMTQIILTIAITFTLLNCKAQSPVLEMVVDALNDAPDNSYYKDVNNVLNDFEGTWLYTNGNTSLKITLVKYLQLYNGKYYEDLLIGGYQYIENGIELVNTLDDANNPNLGISASIDGNLILKDCNYHPVNDCVDGEKSLRLGIDDPNSDKHWGILRLFKRTINGQDALKIIIEMTHVTDGEDPEDGDLPSPSIPWHIRNINLIKQ